MTRKFFIQSSAGIIAGSPLVTFAKPLSIAQDSPPPMSIELIEQFVRAGHKDLSTVKEMVAEHPNLVYTKYDWGNGDYESALEGAGHLGKKDIANFLIEKGSRVNLFVLTMLGKTAIVKSTLEAYPNLLYALGPHGFTLLHHANMGGEASAELKEYITAKGLTKTKEKLQ